MKHRILLVVATLLVVLLTVSAMSLSRDFKTLQNDNSLVETRVASVESSLEEAQQALTESNTDLQNTQSALATSEAEVQDLNGDIQTLEDALASAEEELGFAVPENCFEFSAVSDPKDLYIPNMYYEGYNGHVENMETFISADSRTGVIVFGLDLAVDVNLEVNGLYDIVVTYDQIDILCNEDNTALYIFYGRVSVETNSNCPDCTLPTPPAFPSVDDINA